MAQAKETVDHRAKETEAHPALAALTMDQRVGMADLPMTQAKEMEAHPALARGALTMAQRVGMADLPMTQAKETEAHPALARGALTMAQRVGVVDLPTTQAKEMEAHPVLARGAPAMAQRVAVDRRVVANILTGHSNPRPRTHMSPHANPHMSPHTNPQTTAIAGRNVLQGMDPGPREVLITTNALKFATKIAKVQTITPERRRTTRTHAGPESNKGLLRL
jgi:hypothetical protein